MTDMSGEYEYDCQEELNRKTFEAMEMFDAQYRSGRISEEAYHGALLGINACTRGLVPESYALALDQEVSLLPQKFTRTAIWVSSATVYLMTMTVGDDSFVVRTIPNKGGKKIIRGEDTDSVMDALRKFKLFEAKLEANGYKKL